REYEKKFEGGNYSSFFMRYDIIVNYNDKGNIFKIPLHELENVQNRLINAYDKRMAIVNEKLASAPNSIIRDLYLSKKIHMLHLKEESSPDETLKMIETMENIFVDNIIFVPVIDSDEFKKHPVEYLNKLERIARRAKQKEKVAQLNYYIYSTASNYLDGSDPELFDRIESRMNRIVMDADEDWVKEAAVKLINRVKIKNMDTAPDFEFVTLEGKKSKLSDYRGKWVLLNFWSSGCGWCIREFPFMKAAYDMYRGRDFEIISINTDGKAATAEYLKEFTKEKDLIWVNTSDNFGYSPGLSKKYGVSGVPAMYMIDPQGRFIKDKMLRGDELKKTVGELLAAN
ncbi:MAG: TlpA family protein disulfide reductase, partial [Candidatus Kapaibacterium sp.]